MRLHHVDRAIAVIGEEISTTGDASIAYMRADQIVSAILPGNGTHESDLLFQLIASGLLSIDQIDGKEFVRFTFERYGDHTAARGLLDRSVASGDLQAAMAGSTPLSALFAADPWRHQGVVESLAVLLPEFYGIELWDVASSTASGYSTEEAFIASLPTRAPDAFANRTWELIREVGGSALEFDTLIQLSTDPDSQFNAKILHNRLIKEPMPDRDADWSTHLAQNSEMAGRLIDWVLEADMSRVAPDRAALAATCLTWFFTTTNRRTRDRATKA